MWADCQDSYALCRVFKKNGICSEIEEQQGQCSGNNNIALLESSQSLINESETMSPDIPMSSPCVDADQDDKDDSWMQFITDDDSWYPNPNNNVSLGGNDVSRLTFAN